MMTMIKLSRAKFNYNHKRVKKLTIECNIIANQISQIREHLKNIEDNELLTIDSVIIIFNQSQDAQILLDKLDFGFCKRLFFSLCCCFKRYKFKQRYLLKVVRAPEPTDIKWDTLNSKLKTSIKKNKFKLFSLSMVILVCYAVVIFIYLWKIQNITSFFYSLAAASLISLINIILGIYIPWSTKFFRYNTYTKESIMIFNRVLWSNFLNSAGINLICQLAYNSTIQNKNFQTFHPLIENMFSIFLFNTLINPLMNIFNPISLYKAYQRINLNKNSDQYDLTQYEVNKLYEDPEFVFATKYANIMKTMLISGLFAPFMPIGLLISIIELILHYYTDKFLIEKRKVSFARVQISSHLSTYAIEMLQAFVHLYVIGIFCFQAYMYLLWMDTNKEYVTVFSD